MQSEQPKKSPQRVPDPSVTDQNRSEKRHSCRKGVLNQVEGLSVSLPGLRNAVLSFRCFGFKIFNLSIRNHLFYRRNPFFRPADHPQGFFKSLPFIKENRDPTTSMPWRNP